MKSHRASANTAIQPPRPCSCGNHIIAGPNQLASVRRTAPTRNSAPEKTTPATISITNATSLCMKKLYCFSTPQAWFHRRRDRTEHTHGRPYGDQRARDTELDRRFLQVAHLRAEKVEIAQGPRATRLMTACSSPARVTASLLSTENTSRMNGKIDSSE